MHLLVRALVDDLAPEGKDLTTVAVTLTGTLTGVRLLHGRERGYAAVASAFLGFVLVLCGPLLVIPAAVGAAALFFRARLRSSRRPLS